MRAAIVALAIVAAAGARTPAAARMIMGPMVSRACPSAPSWPKVTACLARLAKVEVVGSMAGAKIVKLTSEEWGGDVPGVYVYVQARNGWVLGGMYQAEHVAAVSGFVSAKAGRFTGYRFQAKIAMVDDILVSAQLRHGYVRKTLTVFCSGQTRSCTPAMTSCDVYIEGRSYWTFRGTLELKDREVVIHGDRTNAEGDCAQEETLLLPFVEPALD